MAAKPKRAMTWIKLRRNVGLHRVGTVVEMEEPIARAHLEAGAATAAKAPTPTTAATTATAKAKKAKPKTKAKKATAAAAR